MVYIDIKVIPNAKNSRIILDKNCVIKCYVVSQPEDGKANKEVIFLFANKLNIPKSYIEIERGLISRNKRISIKNIDSVAQLYKLLELEIQSKI